MHHGLPLDVRGHGVINAEQTGPLVAGGVLGQAEDVVQVDEDTEHEHGDRLVPVEREESYDNKADQDVRDRQQWAL